MKVLLFYIHRPEIKTVINPFVIHELPEIHKPVTITYAQQLHKQEAVKSLLQVDGHVMSLAT